MEARLRAARTVWLALTAGLAIATIAVFCLLTVGGLHVDALPPAGALGGAVAEAVAVAAGMLVRSRMIAAIPRDADEETRLAQYLTAVIIGLALIEGGGLFMITLGLIADAPGWVLAGGVAAVWMMVLGRPRADEATLRRSGRA